MILAMDERKYCICVIINNRRKINMRKGKTWSLTTAFVSIFCVLWALSISSYGMAVALILNALLCIFFAFRFDKDAE